MTSSAPGNLTVDPPLPRPTLITLQLLPLIPVLLVTVLLAAAFTGDDDAMATLEQNAAGILGNTALLSLAVTFAITPVTTVTGWRWHQIPARDLGLWTFALAALDLVLAATMSTDGWRAGVAGQAFLVAGTLATLLLVPLAITSNRWSMRRFGIDWKRLHRLVYVVLALVTLQLLLLPGGPEESGQLMVFVPSLLLRVPPVRRRVIRARESFLSRRAGGQPEV